jgi:MoaA/NifB/PqqE/SkfB family radical SAM enzyme
VNVLTVLSMLHEPPGGPDSATRRFRGEAPVAWTLFRLARCPAVSKIVILCWDDQAPAVAPIAAEQGVEFIARSARTPLPHLDSVTAARRWADGWRGGLLWTCEFDRGFHGPWIAEIAQQSSADALLLVDPSAALVDPTLIAALIKHAASQPDVDFFFSQAAPGLSGVLLRKSLAAQLAAGDSHPGTLLGYLPDLPLRDAISAPSCAPVPTPVARTRHRFTFDSQRQIDRISRGTTHLNGELIATEAQRLVSLLDASADASTLPREVILELTTRRASRPIHCPATHHPIDRSDLSADTANLLFEELKIADDLRLVFAGVGDPLLHPDLFSIIDNARRAGIHAIAIETDLIGVDASVIQRLADSPVDVISLNLPAVSQTMYQTMMGVDGLKSVMENLSKLISRRQSNRRGTPLVAPTFVKTGKNLAEMEAWYDHWLRTLGCAVIIGPSDFAGRIPDLSVAHMQPPRRRPCARLAQRLTVLCDGRVVSCEQDFNGAQTLGRIGDDSIGNLWAGAAAAMNRDHAAGNWARHPVCASCKEWHRP